MTNATSNARYTIDAVNLGLEAPYLGGEAQHLLDGGRSRPGVDQSEMVYLTIDNLMDKDPPFVAQYSPSAGYGIGPDLGFFLTPGLISALAMSGLWL